MGRDGGGVEKISEAVGAFSVCQGQDRAVSQWEWSYTWCENDLALIQFSRIQIKLVLKILENRSSIHASPNSLTTYVYVNFKAKGKIQKNEPIRGKNLIFE